MSEFYDEYTDDEDENTVSESLDNDIPKIDMGFEKIKNIINQENLDLESMIDDLQKKMNMLSQQTKEDGEPPDLVEEVKPGKKVAICTNTAL